MKYVSVDIETTGVDPDISQILSIGAIIEDTETKLPYEDVPKFHAAIDRTDLFGSIFAINMNKTLIENIVKWQSSKSEKDKAEISASLNMEFLPEDKIVEKLFYWMFKNGFSNQWDFVTNGREYLDRHVFIEDGKVLPVIGLKTKPITFSAAGKNFATFDKKFLEKLPRWQQCFKIRQRVIDPAILYVDWQNDETLPDLSTCKVRAYLPSIITHNALEDAWDVIQVLRKTY
jgi:oligoribonuclease